MVVPKNPNSWLCDHEHYQLLSAPIGILTFEAAAAMSRLVSLHRSLSEPELHRLRADAMRSAGVAYLTSTDQHFLFRLACAEFLSDLDASAATVSRFSTRCNAEPLLLFPRTYADVKAGRATTNIRTLSVKGVERRVKKMEKCIAVVVKLLEEIEAGEKDMALMKFGRLLPQKPVAELKLHGKKVAKLKEQSLWCKTFDEVVELMSGAVLAIFARICAVFSPFVEGLPPILISGGRMRFTLLNPKLRIYPRFAGRHYASGPIDRAKAAAKEVAIRNSCPIIGRGSREEVYKLPEDCKKVLQPGERTVGGSGLAIQYASIILSAERLMRIRSGAEEAEEGEEVAVRDEIYRMLPAKLKETVRRRLREKWKERGLADGELADGWREAVERILRWLSPVARDTEKWGEERTMDKKQRLNTKPRVLALQTFMFSDREKVEMAIVEVLVGFSCICWYDGAGVGGHGDRTR
ncbi:uncharacterized protein LOC110096056 [Dendrobium catenatum]|uniref:DUF668 domain-containing protein n=1 Tax=Dendrobium catenatum TaxID=906689 RepID=A0A2I0WAX5_9ASPA|nr:uncharacterized protein LOC110096056 [Dendrobium catenatum]PKU72807.1 hypothetical protein MA16_Dca017126 [Dendrobium catenatum]